MNKIIEQLYMTFLGLEQNGKIKEKFQDFASINLEQVEKTKNEFGPSDQFYELHEGSDGYVLQWKKDTGTSIGGKINILKLQYFLDGIKIQEPHLTVDDELFYFHPIDLFADEAHCGIFIRNGKIEDRMFFHRFGETEVYDLKIDFYTYLQLANMARGYFYWPKYLLEKITGEKSVESDDFQKNMPEIFPDFKLEEFDKLFESSRK